MSNYGTECCFVLPCTVAEAVLIKRAFDSLTGVLEQPPIIITENNTGKLTLIEKLVSHAYYNHPEYISASKEKPPVDVVEMDWDFELKVVNELLQLEGSGCLCDETITVFTQAVLVALNSKEMIAIGFSSVCDQFKPGAFGGYGCVVTQDVIRWQAVSDFFDLELTSHAKQKRYYICCAVEINGDIEYLNTFVMRCASSESPRQKLHNIVLNLHPGGTEKDNDYIQYDGGLNAKSLRMAPITPLEYQTLSQYLAVH